MAQRRIVLGILLFFSGHFGFVSTQSTNVCKTFGSGVMQTFNGTMFHVKTTCPVTLTHFSYKGVDCFISVQRDQTGIMKRVEIYVNKIATIIQDGILTVEGNSISLPYDHTYQKVYAFGIYTKLTSKVLPFSVTWYSLPMGVTRFWVQLDRPLVDGMTGMCGRQNSSETRAELLDRNVIHDDICVTGDSQPLEDTICNEFKSNARECLGKRLYIFDQLCKLNMYINIHESAKCSFYEEFFYFCNQSYALQTKLRNITSCKEHHCPGDLLYKGQGAAFPPTCSNPQLQTDFQTATCLPPNGLVVNDRVESYHSVKVEDCPCVHRGNIYAPRDKRSTKCQTCECIEGKWICSANTCMTPCIIEGWFVTTFDGKQYSLPGTCTYVASRGLNWTITVRFSAMTIEEIYLDVYQERYIFSLNSVQLRENEITATDLSQTEHVTVYWQSSMFVKVQTSFGMKMQVQVSPEVQMYLYLIQNVVSKGLCGSNNNNTEDDFTTSSGIVENSAQPFALSWTLGDCTANNPYSCINTNNELFAEDKCSQLTNTSGVFALCHEYVPVNSYLDACIRRTCQASSGLQEHVCVGLGNYAKACASQGIIIGDWRAETACTPSCESNLRFDYTMQACNRTCRSLSGTDPTCDMPDDLVEGCGCPPGTHLNTPLRCSPRALCQCNYPGGTTPPGPVVIDGRQCMCENGYLQCSDNCDCPNGQICVHCAQAPVNTGQRTCESLSKPSSSDLSCISGCYCPEGQYADHNGNCVTPENCTCEFSGMVYASGQAVESNCKTCTCRGGQWDCKGDPCPGVCEVFGNGQYKTFDSKWYRFDGHCQYTLVEDINGLFSINAESVPCCDEVLTCSRAISVKLKDEVILTLRDMNITQKFLDGWRLRAQPLYSVHTVGLYIIISVSELGLRVIWDKQTKVTIELQTFWNGQVHGLCGDFDGKLMNDMLTRSSTVVFSTLEFGNSWKTAVPPCSDVTQELFPCERHSYCAAWAQRRCMILQSDTFKACHLKVDPTPYYQACILESCSCDFEGKFLGFCTAVAAYAEACTTQNVCIKWRTPDLCPVYCDYYNEEGQCSWHYEACPQHIKTCGKNNKFSGKLEGCYPRCPSEKPYYDENRRICSSLDKCTCYFNYTVVEPGANVTTPSECCVCIEGQLICEPCITTTSAATTVTSQTSSVTTTTTTNTPIITSTEFLIITGTTKNHNSSSPQVSNYTTTPGITSTTTEESTTTTPFTTIAIDTTLITTTTATETPITQTSQTTEPVTITGTTTNQASPSPQESTYTTTTPGITTKTTEESTATTPFTTIATDTTLITTTTATETPITQTSQTTEPVTITGTTTNQASPSPQESTYTTTTPGITTKTTEESTATTPFTTIATDTTLITTTTATETPITQTSQTTEPVTITGTTTNQASPSPQESTYTTTTPGITTKMIEESTTTTPLTTFTTDTTLITTTTATETPITQTSQTTITGTTTNQASPSPQESTYTTTTPGITTKTTEESTTTTPFTTITTATTLITTTTATETPITQTSQTTITGTTTNQASPSSQESTYTTTTPGITTKTTEESTATTPFTTIATDTTLITTTTATETPITQTSQTTEPVTITGTTTNQASPSPQESTYTTTTPGITTKTTEESTATTPFTTIATDTTLITTTTATETPITQTSQTTEPVTITGTTTNQASPSPQESTYTTTTPGITTKTTEESTATTPFTTIATDTTLITTTTATETPITQTSQTTEPVTITGTTTNQASPSPQESTYTTTTPGITTKTTEESTATTPFTTIATDTTLITTTTATETPITQTSQTTEPVTITGTTTNQASPSPQESTYTTTTPGITTKTTEESTTTTPFTTIATDTTLITTTTATETPITQTSTTTKTPESTSIPATTTAHYTACYDLIRNQTWPEGYEWTEDCFTKICKNNVIELRPLICPTPVVPVCPRGMPKLMKDKQGCCDTWQCDCQCDVFGDPHYTTFAGQDFTFLENCTYVLVEERTALYNLSISVDNYYCEPSASCAKGIIVQYQNNTVMLQVVEVPDDIPILQITVNQVTIKAPYQAHGLSFESTDAEIYIYIKEIRSYISLSVWNTLQINLAMEHFFNNTQGQCGVCGGDSCIRRNGTAEREDCCDKTAYEWIENDPMKPYCQQAPRHVPCFPDIPTTSPGPTPPPCTAPLCDLLRHQVFSKCRGDIDVEKLVNNCKFDYCVAQNNASVCSPLERLADHCKKMGTCVAWRNLTRGICDNTCPEGMIFDECRSTPTDFCRGGVRVSGTVLDTVRSGCFCPNNQLLAERHKTVCVSECTNCKGPLGEPMLVGETWESNCHMCTCNNQTLTEECWPKPTPPSPICSPGFALISDCCDNPICVEKTCEYSGTTYKVGETWRDPKTPCLSYRCTSSGTEIERTVCPQQFCPEELRFWDENHCCYSCNTTCGVKLSRMTFENCTQEVMLPTCEGNCASGSFWLRSGIDLKLEHNQSYCRERDYEIRQISLVCSGATATQYTYKHITSCECQREV
ncbi:mucin-2-like [Tachysurus fulvidraco]|uniref:mucin-2-like n=1 Tax=Tachysurus fulvidraco TaxID=1234273 RepID=UPI001FEF000B|nr:mucin-2-like [Tachysurus fulvidraco]